MNIWHYGKRIASIAFHAVIGVAGFAVCYFLIRVLLSLLVFIPAEVRQITSSLLAALAVCIVLFFISRTQGINDSVKRQHHPIVTVVCNVAMAVVLGSFLYRGTLVFKGIWFDSFQSVAVPIAAALGDIAGYTVGCRLAKTAYSGCIKPGDDDPISRPGEERSWRDSIK